MRSGELHRDIDASGVSGTGIVAEIVEFTDGTVVLRWGGDYRTTVVHDSGIDGVDAIHGHGGMTRIVWLDEGG